MSTEVLFENTISARAGAQAGITPSDEYD